MICGKVREKIKLLLLNIKSYKSVSFAKHRELPPKTGDNAELNCFQSFHIIFRKTS